MPRPVTSKAEDIASILPPVQQVFNLCTLVGGIYRLIRDKRELTRSARAWAHQEGILLRDFRQLEQGFAAAQKDLRSAQLTHQTLLSAQVKNDDPSVIAAHEVIQARTVGLNALSQRRQADANDYTAFVQSKNRHIRELKEKIDHDVSRIFASFLRIIFIVGTIHAIVSLILRPVERAPQMEMVPLEHADLAQQINVEANEQPAAAAPYIVAPDV